VVRGTTSENETVKTVLVNGRAARAMAPNFAEWEITLEGVPGREVTLTAHAVDDSGNVEPRSHRLLVRLPQGSGREVAVDVLNLPSEERRGEGTGTSEAGSRPTGEPGQGKAPRDGAAAEALQGTWQVVSQERAGRATARPKNMKWVIEGDTVWLVPGRGPEVVPPGKGQAEKRNVQVGKGGKQAGSFQGLRMNFRLDPAKAAKQIDLDGPKKSISYGIYQLDGDELRVCVGITQPSPTYDKQAKGDEHSRPVTLSPDAGTLIVLRRVKE
jgi:uncharacterized protein (TIGR03067 family)